MTQSHNRTLLILAGSTVFVMLALFLAFRIAGARQGSAADAKRAYAQELAALQQAGVPVRMSELKSPLPPPDQNAATLYVELNRRLKAHPLSKEEQIVDELAKRPLSTPDELRRAAVVLRNRADLLGLVHQAAGREICLFDRNWETPNPASIVFPELAVMREGARMLAAQSLLLAHDGKSLDAVQNQALGFRLARHAAGDKTLIAYLVGIALDSITLTGMEKILYLSKGDPIVARAVKQAIEKEWTDRSLVKALHSETAFQIGMVEYLRKYGPGDLNVDPKADTLTHQLAAGIQSINYRDPKRWNAYLDSNGTIIVRRMRQVLSVADHPYPESSRVLHTIGTEVDNDKDPMHALCAILFPVYEQVANKKASIEARRNVVYTACALLEWKGTHGGFPPTLQGVLKPLPTDPYDGKPLRYHPEGAGFVVYSVGDKGTFTGGSPDQKPDKNDVVFRYPAPAYYLPTAPR